MSFDLTKYGKADTIARSVTDAAMELHKDVVLRSIVPASDDGRNFARLAAAAWQDTVDRGMVDDALELGCYHGLSAAVLALAGWRVTTYDVSRTRWAGPLWDGLGIRHRIQHRLRGGPIIPPRGQFGFAFIDAVHDVDHMQADWSEILPLLGPGAVVAFDDIRYGPGTLDWFLSLPGRVDLGRFGYVVR